MWFNSFSQDENAATNYRLLRVMRHRLDSGTGADKLILEVALLNVRSGESAAFEQAFANAQAIISSMDGYLSHQLQRSLETPGKYFLLVHWRRVEDHTVGFRQSTGYQEWRRLLHHFYDPPPVVEHFEAVLEGSVRKDL
jgi:heme-degrading monooxygenase HmoA